MTVVHMKVNEIVWSCFVLFYCPEHLLLSGALKYILNVQFQHAALAQAHAVNVQKGSMYYLPSVPLQLSGRGARRLYHTGDNTVIAWCFS